MRGWGYSGVSLRQLKSASYHHTDLKCLLANHETQAQVSMISSLTFIFRSDFDKLQLILACREPTVPKGFTSFTGQTGRLMKFILQRFIEDPTHLKVFDKMLSELSLRSINSKTAGSNPTATFKTCL
jgi:hypothetical protein